MLCFLVSSHRISQRERSKGLHGTRLFNCIGRKGGCGKPRAEARVALFWGTCKLENGLDETRDQVVVVSFRDLAAEKSAFADLRLIVIPEVVDKDFAIDLGSVHLRPAFPEQVSFFGWTFEN